MNYYILLINIVLMCAIYFSITVIINSIGYIYNKKSFRVTKLLVLASFFIALYNYLIMSQT